MPSLERAVLAHYARGDLPAVVRAELEAQGIPRGRATLDDLKALDHFHTRGIAATRDLANLLAPRPGAALLDIGSGVGGPARYLAYHHGVDVTGIDLTPDYCRVARLLSEWTALRARTRFAAASATALPFASGTFELAWMQNVQMNIADKSALYGELARALRPGGRLAFSEVLVTAPHTPIHLPVPWAETPALSFLLTAEALRQHLAQAGLAPVAWEDVTEPYLAMHRKQDARGPTEPPPLSTRLLMGDNAAEKAGNHRRNVEEGRMRLLHAVVERQD